MFKENYLRIIFTESLIRKFETESIEMSKNDTFIREGVSLISIRKIVSAY